MGSSVDEFFKKVKEVTDVSDHASVEGNASMESADLKSPEAPVASVPEAPHKLAELKTDLGLAKLKEQLGESAKAFTDTTLSVELGKTDIVGGPLAQEKSQAVNEQVKAEFAKIPPEAVTAMVKALQAKYPGSSEEQLKTGLLAILQLSVISGLEGQNLGDKDKVTVNFKGFALETPAAAPGTPATPQTEEQRIAAKKEAIEKAMKGGGFWASVMLGFIKSGDPSMLDKLAKGEGGFMPALLGIMGVDNEEFQKAAAELRKTAGKSKPAADLLAQFEAMVGSVAHNVKEFTDSGWKEFLQSKRLEVARAWPKTKVQEMLKMYLPEGGRVMLAAGEKATIKIGGVTKVVGDDKEPTEIADRTFEIVELPAGAVIPQGTWVEEISKTV